jgi:hypothetical protein
MGGAGLLHLLAIQLAAAQVPTGPPVYQMNLSTIIMPCNDTGPTDPQSTKGWGTIDFDWSNWKGTGAADGWAKQSPMDCEERLATQVQMTTADSPSTKVWVYRNSILALPWYTSVRVKLEDPAYAFWFMTEGERDIGGSGGSTLEPPGPLLTHLRTVYMGYYECLPGTRLNPPLG